jgi:tRNA(Ile)-lysidine synthase
MEWQNTFQIANFDRFKHQGIPSKDTFFYFCNSNALKMLQKFKKYIMDNSLIKPDDRILLAVSGGIDSMVMTHLFIKSGYTLGIAHCNFSLRYTESDMDEEMVSEFAAQHNIQFFSTRFDTKNYARENGLSVQMAARELRYRWFENIRKEHNYNSVAVAHNLNDNIETMLINLLRGTGTTGLAGMKPVSNNIIRPMLFATRKEIVFYCNRNRISYREDISNNDTKYIRNKIRHLIIPLLKDINPSVESTLSEAAERFSGINEIISDYINELREKVSLEQDDCTAININLLKPHLHNKVVLFELFRPYGIADIPINDLYNIIKGKTGGRVFTSSHRIVKNRKELLVSKERSDPATIRLISNLRHFERIPEIEYAKTVKITEKFEIPSEPSFVCLDFEKLSFPLILRKWNSGDHFYPLGMNHRKKLSDYFIDNKYSLFDKENALILESGGKIICILGDRIDNRFKITTYSKNVLIIKARKGL